MKHNSSQDFQSFLVLDNKAPQFSQLKSYIAQVTFIPSVPSLLVVYLACPLLSLFNVMLTLLLAIKGYSAQKIPLIKSNDMDA